MATPPGSGPTAPSSRAKLEGLFTSALPDVDRAVRAIARRHALRADEIEEFAPDVGIALIDHDYAILGQFRGQSSLATFLTTVIQRLFIDRRRRAWGRWHPSAAARRLGPIAERLELLIYRDGRSVTEACQTLATDLNPSPDRKDLEDLVRRIPVRQRVRVDSVGTVEDLRHALDQSQATDTNSPHSVLQSAESTRRCQAAVARALADMSAHDRVLLRLRYEDGLSVASIARMSSLDQKELYRHLERLLKRVRARLESEGVGWNEVAGLVEAGSCQLGLAQEPPPSSPENGAKRPSTLEAES